MVGIRLIIYMMKLSKVNHRINFCTLPLISPFNPPPLERYVGLGMWNCLRHELCRASEAEQQERDMLISYTDTHTHKHTSHPQTLTLQKHIHHTYTNTKLNNHTLYEPNPKVYHIYQLLILAICQKIKKTANITLPQ